MHGLLKRHAVPVLVLMLIGVWASTTPFRLRVFRDSITLWSVTTQQAPLKPRPWINLGDAFNIDHQPVESIKALTIAKAVLPDAPIASDRKAQWTYLVNMELGSFAQKAGFPEIAAGYFAEAIRAEPWRTQVVSAR